MELEPLSVQQIYQERRQYRVPFYQRSYVWNRDDQWGKLWEDVREKAEIQLQGARKLRGQALHLTPNNQGSDHGF